MMQLLLASGCSLSSPSTSTVSIAIGPGDTSSHQESPAITASPSPSFSPTSLASFNCFAIDINGAGIPPNPMVNCQGGQQPLGIVGGMIPASTGGSLDLAVPTGRQTIDLLGFESDSGVCPPIEQVISAPQGSNNGIHGPYLLGRTVTDVVADTTVEITASFTPGAPKLYPNCATGGAPWNPNDNDGTATTSAGQLAFLALPPAANNAGTPTSPQPAVQIEDSNGDVIATDPVEVSLALFEDSQCSIPQTENAANAAAITNATATTAASGIADFTDFAINLAGTHYLQASAPGYTSSACAGPITVAPLVPSQLDFTNGNNQTIAAGTCSALIRLGLYDSYMNPASSTATLVATLTGSSGSGSLYTDSACSYPATGITFSPGEQATSLYFKSTTAGSTTFTYGATIGGATLTPATLNFTTTP